MKSRGRKKAELIDDQNPATKIKQLRKRYGAGLAPDWNGACTLGELLKVTRFESLTQYVKHHGRYSEDQAKPHYGSNEAYRNNSNLD